jgi:hypothetical protein
MISATELQNLLAYCNCTEHYYRHSFCRNFVYTDGIKVLAENAGAYWLIDAIASHQKTAQKKLDWFQLWELTKQPNNTWLLTCRADTGETPVVSQEIEYSDFPLNSIKLYVEGSGDRYVLLLPSEH